MSGEFQTETVFLTVWVVDHLPLNHAGAPGFAPSLPEPEFLMGNPRNVMCISNVHSK